MSLHEQLLNLFCAFVLLKRGAAACVQAQDAGESEVQKAQRDLGLEVGVFATVEASCLSA